MKGLARAAALLAAAASVIVSCSKDKESGSIRFERPALYLESGQSGEVAFSLDNIQPNTLAVTSRPSGWEQIAIDISGCTLSVVAPAAAGDETAASGSVVLTGVPNGNGSVATATLFVGIASSESLSGPANSFLLNRAATNYRFDAMHNSSSELATARLEVLWQSVSGLVQYLHLDGEEASFYVDAASDGSVKEGNALIGAFDADDNLVWSWHLWSTDYDPEKSAVRFGDHIMMDRNLGALSDLHATDAEKLASYGLFYQWGRKEPFIGPSSYDAAGGTSAAMYNGSGSRVYLKIVASDAETGTMAYAVQNPLTFITASEKDADWLQEGPAAASRWSAEGKGLYDPCPYGWRVAPADAFEGLRIRESLDDEGAGYETQYGWTLGDGAAESFFMAAGRRSWRDGSVQNYFDESLPSRTLEMQPWVGYYWTAGSEGALSPAFCFWFKAGEAAASDVRNGRPMGRANGMQVRCVKAE